MATEASRSDKTPSFEMTWGSSTSSGYCSEEDSDSEFDQYFTARTSFFPKARKANANTCLKQVRGSVSLKQNKLGYSKQKRKSGQGMCDLVTRHS